VFSEASEQMEMEIEPSVSVSKFLQSAAWEILKHFHFYFAELMEWDHTIVNLV
jgi:hypothetical protein